MRRLLVLTLLIGVAVPLLAGVRDEPAPIPSGYTLPETELVVEMVNPGSAAATVNVSASIDGKLLGTQTVSIGPGESETIVFTIFDDPEPFPMACWPDPPPKSARR